MAFRFRRMVGRFAGIAPTVSSGSHGYFNDLSTRPQIYYARSLRTQSQLSSLSPAGYTYVFDSGDPYETPQDAAKFIWESSAANADSLTSTITASTSGDFFLTWDAWYSSHWTLQRYGGNVATSNASTTFDYTPYRHKEFQIRMSTGATGTDAIYFETNIQIADSTVTGAPAGGGSTSIGNVNYRTYDISASSLVNGRIKNNGGLPIPDGLSTSSPSSGLTNCFFVQPRVWTRFYQRIKLNQWSSNGEFASWSTATGQTLTTGVQYHSWSAWVSDENREPVAHLLNVPIYRAGSAGQQARQFIRLWQLEMNTSHNHYQSTGTITVTGDEGVVVPSTQLFHRVSDSAVFKADNSSAGWVISGGSVEIPITAVSTRSGTYVSALGPDGDTSSGTVMVIRPGSSVEGFVNSSAIVTRPCINGNYILNADCVSYFRNIAILKDYGDPAALLIKPVP